MELLGHTVICLTFEELPNCFPTAQSSFFQKKKKDKVVEAWETGMRAFPILHKQRRAVPFAGCVIWVKLLKFSGLTLHPPSGETKTYLCELNTIVSKVLGTE